MASKPKSSGIPCLGLLVIAGLVLLALGGGGLLVYVWLTATGPVAIAPPAPAATQAVSTQVAVQPALTAVVLPTVTSEAAGEAATLAPAAESATSAPAPTDTVPADTPTPSVTPAPVLTLLQSANVRGGPGVNYPVIGGLQGGKSMPAIGRDSAGYWYVISYGSGQGWVSSQVASYSGDTSSLAVVKAPPPPPPTAVPPTPVPPTAVPPTNPPAPSAHGMLGSLTLCDSRTTYAAGERICFTEKIYNAGKDPVNYGVLGVNAINITGGPSWFQSSWTGFNHANNVLTLLPGCTGPVGYCDGPWQDGFKLQAGTYQLTLSICYSNAKTCQGGGVWETLTSPITIVVQ